MAQPSVLQTNNAISSKTSLTRSLRWRVVDIAVGPALGVMAGVVSWIFDNVSYGIFPMLTLILPGSAALLHALWYFQATLGLLILRKPGAAIYVVMVGAFAEAVLGTKYSVSFLLPALLQALSAEAVFGAFRYRRWTLGVTVLAACAIAVVYNFYLMTFYYQSFTFFSPRGIIGTICELISGVVFAGFGSWWLYRAVAKAGVLDRFASGRE